MAMFCTKPPSAVQDRVGFACTQGHESSGAVLAIFRYTFGMKSGIIESDVTIEPPLPYKRRAFG